MNFGDAQPRADATTQAFLVAHRRFSEFRLESAP
jgi:hypothetical protein